MDIIPIKNLFFPTSPSLPLNTNNATHSLQQQKIARVTKTIFYCLATLTTAFALSFSSFVAMPLTLTAAAIAAISWGIFYRLHKMDGRYTEGLDSETRADLAKQELQALFCQPLERDISPPAVKKSLEQINRILGYPALSFPLFDDNEPLHCSHQWFDRGYYGLPSFDCSLTINWSKKALDPIEITLERKERVPEKEATS